MARPSHPRRAASVAAAVVAVTAVAVGALIVGRIGTQRSSDQWGERPCEPPAPALDESAAPVPGPADALQERALTELAAFTGWLERGEAAGFIGEVGWPNDESSDRWNALADLWYDAAARTGLWVTAWAAGEWWGSYPLSVYSSSDGEAIDGATVSADVVERHRRAPGARGVNVNGAEFGIGENLGVGQGGAFSNVEPGTYGEDWRYPSEATFRYLACREVDIVRLPFRWERIQPEPGGDLAADELARLREAVSAAGDAGLRVVPTVMNYGAYWMGDRDGVARREPIGSAAVTSTDFADLWFRLAAELRDAEAVVAWGIMNEPVDLPGGAPTWEDASQAAVSAVRAAGDDRAVLVPGYSWSTVTKFPEEHPGGPWIDDPVGDVRYEAHHYFDSQNSGEYADYDEELARAAAMR